MPVVAIVNQKGGVGKTTPHTHNTNKGRNIT